MPETRAWRFAGIDIELIPHLLEPMLETFMMACLGTLLGLVGAGGLGFSLIKTMELFQYHKTATCILVIFLLVWASDWICSKWRAKVI